MRITSRTYVHAMPEKRIMVHMKMSLQDYKAKVGECLTKNQGLSTQAKERLMTEYDSDFREFLKEGLSPEAAAAGMVTHLL